MKEGDAWALAVVRRMQRHQVDETTVGIEIVGRRLVRVLMRNWVTRRTPGRAGADRPFFGIYLPAHPENRQMAQRSLIGPGRAIRHRWHGRARHRATRGT